jgi:hypothetical protein
VELGLGPVPSAHALAWIGMALPPLELVRDGQLDLPFHMDEEALNFAIATIRSWKDTAEASDQFTWRADIDPDAALQLMRYWHNLARALIEMFAGTLEPNEDGESFADHVIRRTLDLVVECGRLTSDVADRMFEAWPRTNR